MSFQEVPKHVAIIMDGNGRWAERRSRPRIFGHIRGCTRVKELIREADRLGVKALTLYAFSSENWGRPEAEVSILMKLLYKWVIRQRKELMEKNVQFRMIGAIEKLPSVVQKAISETIELSKNNTGIVVTLALSYSGRDEIVESVRKIAESVKSGKLSPDEINAETISQSLLTRSIGDPDLLIRTSGEQRISNFLLWQIAYSELYFTDTMWPDFKATDFRIALDAYCRRQRRFGLTSGQIEQQSVIEGQPSQ